MALTESCWSCGFCHLSWVAWVPLRCPAKRCWYNLNQKFFTKQPTQQQINNKASQQQPLAQLSEEYRSLYFILKWITNVSGQKIMLQQPQAQRDQRQWKRHWMLQRPRGAMMMRIKVIGTMTVRRTVNLRVCLWCGFFEKRKKLGALEWLSLIVCKMSEFSNSNRK